jgi:hypothetical protein
MHTVVPGLHASPTEPLPFGRSLELRAFLLARKHGNLLVYNGAVVANDVQAIEDLGGISRHCLNHRHEAAFDLDQVANTFGPPLLCHENERPSVSARARSANPSPSATGSTMTST